MASRRPTTREMPPKPAEVVRELRRCRDMLIRLVCMEVRPFGETYRAANAIIQAIDVLAHRLTGEERYFVDKGAGFYAPNDPRRDALMARERGEVPWDVELDPPRRGRRPPT